MKTIRASGFLFGAMAFSILATGCGQEVAKKSTANVTAASFKADPSKMTAEEKANFDRLTGSKPAPAAKTP